MEKTTNKRTIIVILAFGLVSNYAKSQTDFIWGRQNGSMKDEYVFNHVIDAIGNLSVGGSTSGNFGSQQAGDGDCFLLKLNEKGEILWNNQFGTKNHDGLRAIAFNPAISDNMLVSGIMNLPDAQAFIRMYKKDGSLIWERNFIGGSGKDAKFDDKGNFYHVGLTGLNLFGNLIGEHDYYIVKFRLDKAYKN